MLVDRNTKIILLLIASGLWANALVSCIGATASWYSLVESAMPGVDDITQSDRVAMPRRNLQVDPPTLARKHIYPQSTRISDVSFAGRISTTSS